jgi:hypothetical protein
MRARARILVVATGCTVAALAACSDPEETTEVEVRNTAQASSVAVSLLDANGNSVGSCSGTLVSPHLVLTAGHCVASVESFRVESKALGEKTSAAIAVTPWKDFGSSYSHPDHADVALIRLDSPMRLDSYPKLATSRAPDATKAIRFHRKSRGGDVGTSEVTLTNGATKGFRLTYVTDIAKGEYLDTGGAVLDARTGTILGIVSARGRTTGLLYIARVDGFASWIAKSIDCASRDDDGPGSLSPLGWGGGGGGDPWGGGGGSSSGGWSGGSSYGGGGKKIDAGSLPMPDGGAGADAGAGGDGGAGADGGSDGDGDGGGKNGGGTAGNGSTCPPTPTCEGSDCPGKTGGGSPGGGGNGGNGTGPGDGSGGGKNGGGTSSGSPGGQDECPGEEVCPEEPDGPSCSGPTCGGCSGYDNCQDETMEYGDCACGGTSGSGPVIR